MKEFFQKKKKKTRKLEKSKRFFLSLQQHKKLIKKSQLFIISLSSPTKPKPLHLFLNTTTNNASYKLIEQSFFLSLFPTLLKYTPLTFNTPP
jgi:hypothetical protein